MVDRVHSRSRRTQLAAPAVLAAMPDIGDAASDAPLLQLLAEARAAEAEWELACSEEEDNDAGEMRASRRLSAALDRMAAIRAEGSIGIAVKAAWICRSLKAGGLDGHWGPTILSCDIPVAASLMGDLERLIPGVRA